MSSTVVTVALAAVGVLGVVAGVPTAGPSTDAWGTASCDQTPSAACDLDAGSGDGGGATAQEPERRSREPVPQRPGGADRGRGDRSGDSSAVNCSYVRSEFQPPAGGVVSVAFRRALAEPKSIGPGLSAVRRPQVRRVAVEGLAPESAAAGAWHVWKCVGSGERDAFYRPPVWIPDSVGQPAPQGPTPAELAERARRQLHLSVPLIAGSPTGDQLVNLPTWLWLREGFAPVSASAAVPGASVTARAVPRSVTWVMGDGATVVCRGSGTPFTAGRDPRRASPDCGHTYRRSSASEPGDVFRVAATVNWDVTWSGVGEEGTFPGLTTTATTQFRVVEVQALNTEGG